MVGFFFSKVLLLFHVIVYGYSVPIGYCLEPLNKNDCGMKPMAVASYYKEGARCEIEMWRGCPTVNKFPDEVTCSHHCIFRMGVSIEPVRQVIPENDMSEDKNASKGYDSYEGINGRLKIHENPVDWQTARMLCHDEDTLLVGPMMEHQLASVLIKIMNNKKIPAIFMGVRLSSSEGVNQVNEQGKPVLSLDVVGVTPPLDSCSALYANGTVGFVDCSENLPFICYDSVPTHAVTVCGEDPDYQLDDRTGHCYKFHAQSKTWNDALFTCLDEGAHLVIVNSDTEAQVLVDLFAQYPPERLNNTNTRWRVMAVGFFYWKATDTYLTIHGQSIEQAGYAKWGSGQPSSRGTSKELGGGMFRSGLLDDVDQSFHIPFICEKNPLKLQH